MLTHKVTGTPASAGDNAVADTGAAENKDIPLSSEETIWQGKYYPMKF